MADDKNLTKSQTFFVILFLMILGTKFWEFSSCGYSLLSEEASLTLQIVHCVYSLIAGIGLVCALMGFYLLIKERVFKVRLFELFFVLWSFKLAVGDKEFEFFPFDLSFTQTLTYGDSSVLIGVNFLSIMLIIWCEKIYRSRLQE